MHRTSSLTLLFFALTGCSASPSPGPESPSEPAAPEPAAPEPPAEVEFEVPEMSSSEGSFQVVVEREHGSAAEAELIRRAEELCPDQAAVRRAIATYDPNAIPGPEQRCVWWMADAEGIRLPFAVTEEALRYYVDLVELIRSGEAGGAVTCPVDSIDLAYHASFERYEMFVHDDRGFPEAGVARLELRWASFCGTEALGFVAIRQVVFREGEDPVVLGDGDVQVWRNTPSKGSLRHRPRRRPEGPPTGCDQGARSIRIVPAYTRSRSRARSCARFRHRALVITPATVKETLTLSLTVSNPSDFQPTSTSFDGQPVAGLLIKAAH